MTVDEVVRHTLGEPRGGPRSLVLPPAFQGLPGMAHGGTVLALFDAAAGRDGHRHVAAHYRRRVPLGAPLVLEVEEERDVVACRVLDPPGTLLVDGQLMHAGPAAAHPVVPALPTTPTDRRHALPVSAACFVCGITNDVGLQATLVFDERAVHGTWTARAPFRRDDGTVAPAALTALLDEAAFWLGVLATGESGMTTELSVTLHATVPAGTVLTIIGDRASVTPREDPRYLDTSVVVVGPGALPIATGRITFVAVRGAARRLAEGMLAMNGVECLRRVFPAYVR